MKTRGQAKKDLKALQMEVDEPSYDILEWFPILYCQNVFKYLSGKDVIQASAVNKEWRKFTGEKEQMKKVKLVFNQKNSQKLNRESANLIKESERKYQNIEFRNISDRFKKYILEVLENRTGSWKSVKLIGTGDYWTDLDRDMWTAFFEIIEPSVEELSVSEIQDPNKPLEADPKWTFPLLTDLEFDEMSSGLCTVLTSCTSLVKINRECNYSPPTELPRCRTMTAGRFGDRDRLRAELTMLRNNHNLKDLGVTPSGIWEENLVDFKFKLKKLLLVKPLRTTCGMRKMHSFLESQAQSLESLELDGFNRDCLELVLNMPRLTSFTTSCYEMKHAISDETLPLPGNNSIIYLELKGLFFGQQPNSFETLFRALTSLKRFKCDQIDDQMFLALAQEVPALESFEANNFDVSRFPNFDIFPDIREIKVEDFHPNLREPAGDGNFSSLVKEAMRKVR